MLFGREMGVEARSARLAKASKLTPREPPGGPWARKGVLRRRILRELDVHSNFGVCLATSGGQHGVAVSQQG